MNGKKLKYHFQRFEIKYILQESSVEIIVPELLKHMESDPYARDLPDQSYTVSSLYYDSYNFYSYFEKIHGLRNRWKLRLRFYDEVLSRDIPIFLEIKRKYDTVIVKDRLVMDSSECYNILNYGGQGNLDLSEAQLGTLNEFLLRKERLSMVPQIMTVYQRRPFIGRYDEGFRVTIDSRIRASSAEWIDAKWHEHDVLPNLSVLEVKFNNTLPGWFHKIIQRNNLERNSFSKYCHSLEACRPQLSES